MIQKQKRPPAYVSLIINGSIRIDGDLSCVRAQFSNRLKQRIGHWVLDFKEENIPYAENKDLLEKLFDLNEKGIMFGEDYKQLYSPAEFMRDLQIKGVLKNKFISISWSGQGKWHLKENPV